VARIAVFGLGYVGTVSAAAFADNGHQVVGVDLNTDKVEMVNAGRSPVIETGLEDLLRRGVESGRIRATGHADEAILASDLSMICVGTPSNANGSLDLTHVEKVCHEIGLALESKSTGHVVVVRSTMLPGSTEDVVVPTLEQASGKQAGREFGVCVNPEFLREGSSLKDFYEPPFTLIGGSEDRAVASLRDVYSMLKASVIVLPIKVAEMVKYACNAFHALKVTFANEIGNICVEQHIDSYRVIDILCKDTQLNISPAYMKPGFAFGGSCLPKDLRALVYQATRYDVAVPMLEAILQSNARQIEKALQMVQQTHQKRVGVLGLSFKAGTDDLRESPTVELIERLVGKGYMVRVYDKNVSLANLQGSNRTYIEREIPHIASLMTDSLDDVLAQSDVIVIGNRDDEFNRVLREARSNQEIIDLVRISPSLDGVPERYRGICWQ
jgi:GDP-mannose 6-dehydrogenase